MGEKQLNVWIPEELKNYLAQRSDHEGRGMNVIVAELIQKDMVQRQGEIVTDNSLAVLREIVSAEVRQGYAQLRRDLREDRELEQEGQTEWFKKQFDRLAGLLVMSTRNGGIARRLAFTLLSKMYGSNFAKSAYDHAREKAREELLPKKAPHAHVLIEEDES